MKAKRRHELQTNVLADWLGQQIQAIKPYASWIVGGLIAVTVVVLFISVGGSRRSVESAERWERFEEASVDGFTASSRNDAIKLENALQRLQKVADQNAGSPLGVQASLTLGDLYLQSGNVLMRSDNRTSAKVEFKKAAEHYTTVTSSARHALVLNRARFCLGKSYEWLNKFEKAQEAYAQVEQPYRSEAQMRLDDIARKSTHRFYEKFAEWKPKPTVEPGDAERRYPFDLQNLEETADGTFDYQHYLDATVLGVDVPDEMAPDDIVPVEKTNVGVVFSPDLLDEGPDDTVPDDETTGTEADSPDKTTAEGKGSGDDVTADTVPSEDPK